MSQRRCNRCTPIGSSSPITWIDSVTPSVAHPRRVALLFHLIDASDLTALEPAFGHLPFEKRQEFLDHFGAALNPVVMSAVDVRSRTGDRVRVYPILLPVTSHWIKRLIDVRKLRFVQTLVQKGVDVARSLGCSMVSLGQYTSIVTNSGRSLAPLDMGLTSGNSYAIALVVQAIQRAHTERGCDPAESVLAVAGAAGTSARHSRDSCAILPENHTAW